jgi:hypothetical protein
MDAARPTGQPGAGGGGAGGGMANRAATIAKQLGVSTAQVQAAMQTIMPGRPNGGTPPQGAPSGSGSAAPSSQATTS